MIFYIRRVRRSIERDRRENPAREIRLEHADEKVIGAHVARSAFSGDRHRRSQREHHRRVVGRRIAVRARAAHRTAIADLRIAELICRIPQRRSRRTQIVARRKRGVLGERTDRDAISVAFDRRNR